MVKDSPNFQMSLEDSKWVFVKQITITADGDSPNTDGIHIQRSHNVLVYNSNIRTGDRFTNSLCVVHFLIYACLK